MLQDLGASQRREVTAALQKRLGAQAKLLVDFEVDPSVVVRERLALCRVQCLQGLLSAPPTAAAALFCATFRADSSWTSMETRWT